MKFGIPSLRGIATFILIGAIGIIAANINLSRSGEIAVGTVVGLEEHTQHKQRTGGSVYAPIVLFETPDGDEYTITGNGYYNPPLNQVGDMVEVRYEADAPEEGVLWNNDQKYTGPAMMIFFAILLIVVLWATRKLSGVFRTIATAAYNGQESITIGKITIPLGQQIWASQNKKAVQQKQSPPAARRKITVWYYLFGILLIIGPAMYLHNTHTRMAEDGRAIGVVYDHDVSVRRSTDTSERKTMYKAKVRFTTEDGQEVEFTQKTSSNVKIKKVGDSVTVLYDRDNPEDARLFIPLLVYGTTGLIAFCGLALILYAVYWKRKKANIYA